MPRHGDFPSVFCIALRKSTGYAECRRAKSILSCQKWPCYVEYCHFVDAQVQGRIRLSPLLSSNSQSKRPFPRAIIRANESPVTSYILRRRSNGYENTSTMRNSVACLFDGLRRKFSVSGTMALGTCRRTLSFFSSHAVPRSRVTSSRVRQSVGRSSALMAETSTAGPSIFSRVNSGGTSFALV